MLSNSFSIVSPTSASKTMEVEMSEGSKSSPWLISFEDPVDDNIHSPLVVEGRNNYKAMTSISVSVRWLSIIPNNVTKICIY